MEHVVNISMKLSRGDKLKEWRLVCSLERFKDMGDDTSKPEIRGFINMGTLRGLLVQLGKEIIAFATGKMGLPDSPVHEDDLDTPNW